MNRGQVTVQFNGNDVTAMYRVEKGIITVFDGLYEKSTQLGNSPPETIARQLFIQILSSYPRTETK
ncbi:MAG: hypothetical protein JAZ13_00015 [Candidatus Thiodiazotropha taylori]|nr:hypothetical protein [Candidatus Thiodiazotropha taylori]